MKIALVNHSLGSGGAEKLIHDMAIEMKSKNIDIEVILLTNKTGVYDNNLKEKGINVIHLSTKWDIYNPKHIIKLINLLKKYDVVHTHTYASQLWTAFASYFLPQKIKYITTEHSTSNNRRGKWYFKTIDKWMYSRYHKIVSITSATESNLKKWIKDDTFFKYSVIENGIKLENFILSKNIKKTEIHKNLNQNDKILIMVARFSKQKDHKTVIEAMQFFESSIKLLLVGEGELRQEIEEKVKKMNLEGRVLFLGFRKDVPSLLKTSNISILSSNWEGFGLVAAESMATGTPTIVSDVEGLKDVITDGGLTFQKNNVTDLVDKINKILNDEKLYEEISKKGIKKSKRYSIENTVNKYLKLYKN